MSRESRPEVQPPRAARSSPCPAFVRRPRFPAADLRQNAKETGWFMDQPVSMVAETGLEPATSGLWGRFGRKLCLKSAEMRCFRHFLFWFLQQKSLKALNARCWIHWGIKHWRICVRKSVRKSYADIGLCRLRTSMKPGLVYIFAWIWFYMGCFFPLAIYWVCLIRELWIFSGNI